MKNKRMIALLVVFALLQLIFPLAPIAYEKSVTASVPEKGESYTLEYTCIDSFDREWIRLNCENRYTVGYRFKPDSSYPNEIPYNTIGVYSQVIVEKTEDGQLDFYEYEAEKRNDYNWFRVPGAFSLSLDEYEFVYDEFGMKELFDLCFYLCQDNYKSTEDFDGFMHGGDEYTPRPALEFVKLEGKIVLCVYKGITQIKELYIGDLLVLRHK